MNYRDKNSKSTLLPVPVFSRGMLLLLLWILFLFLPASSYSQNLVIQGMEEEQIRLHQLLYGSGQTSLGIRPVWSELYDASIEELPDELGLWSRNLNPNRIQGDNRAAVRAGIYNPVSRFTHNSSVPRGENNEAAWYGRGFNSEWFLGGWISSDYFTITFRPQFVWQQNLQFEDPRFIPFDENGQRVFSAEAVGEFIDAPFRFGNESFTSFSHGYTSLRLHYGAVEAGFSTEPLAWGANIHYPLLLSNNAPGMQHLFLGTRKPISLPWLGAFEFSFLGAFPEDSDFFESNESATEPRRFINGINVVYSPSFISNFHVGFARALQKYLENDRMQLSDFGLILDPFYLKEFERTRGRVSSVEPRTQHNLLFARWIWEESHIELYGEFYREDFAWNSRDLLMQPHHNSGYSFGLIKLIHAPAALFYKANLEFVNMTPSFYSEVRPQNYFYSHPDIRQGHTHRGKLLGAAIGPGSNSQHLSVDAYQTWGRIGLYLNRTAHNNHFHYNFDRDLERPEIFRQGFGDYWRNRTDLTIGARGLIQSNSVILAADVAWTRLFNYGRFDYGVFGGTNIANFTPYDLNNLYLQISLTYLF